MRINIAVLRQEEKLAICVEDSGPGLPTSTSGEISFGTGLKNIKERLKALYGDQASLALKDSPSGGLSVQITMPLRYS
jgi:sensor histidine kinase YesM